MEKEAIITMMFPANLSAAWPQVAPILRQAVDRLGTHDVDDIRQAILAGNAQLWVQWNGKCEAALVTEFKSFPKGLFLNVWLFASDPERKPKEEEFEKHIFNFSVANNCVGIRDEGRTGWNRRLDHLPIRCENTVRYLFFKDLEGAVQ